MVKTTKLFAALAVLAGALAAAGCSSRGLVMQLQPQSLELAPGPAGAFLSLAVDSGKLYAVYADPSTTTLDLVTLPEGASLPDSAPAADIIDKVDVAAPLAPFFGEHVLSADRGTIGVLYLDRETDTKNVLKIAWKDEASPQWNLDVLEPAGDPLCLTPDGSGRFTAAWSSGIVSRRGPEARVQVPVPPIALRLEGRAAQTGGEGFTAYDSLASVLLSFQWNGTGYSAEVVPRGSPVHSAVRAASGALAVASYDPGGRRLLLESQPAPGRDFASETVTLCDGTSQVALLPARGNSSFLFLFDETRSMGAGRVTSQLSLIAPGSVLGAAGSRYRKGVLSAGSARIDGFAAARTADSLYVLVSQGDLKLLRVPLHP